MNTHKRLRLALTRTIIIVLLASQPASALAASSWGPTLLVNTESFNVLDEGDGTTDIEIRFGDTLNEKLLFDRTNNRFQFSRTVRINGDVTATGSLSVWNVMSGAALRVDGNADIWGNLSASGTLNIDGAATLSDTLGVTGAATLSSTLTVTGNATFNGATLTIGDASGDSVTVNSSTFTFANDTDFTLSGGVNGLSFDGTTFSVDATNNRIGIGTATPKTTLDVLGTISGSVIHATSNLTSSGGLQVDGAVLFTNSVFKLAHGDFGTCTALETVSGVLTCGTDDGATQSLFETIAVSGESNVVADGATDTLTFANGAGIAITTVASTDTITIAQVIVGHYVNAAGDTMTGALIIDGEADTNQLRVQAHSTQNNDILVIENSAGTDQFTVSNGGLATITGDLTINGGNINFGAATTIGDGGDEITISSNTAVSFSDDNITNVADIALDTISSDALSTVTVTLGTDAGDDFIVGNNNVFRVEGDTDRVAIGQTAPETAFDVVGTISGSKLVISSGELTLRNVAYTFPKTDGGSGDLLRTDGNGNLEWYTNVGMGSGDVLSLTPSYQNAVYFASGSNTVGQLVAFGSGSNAAIENVYRWNSTKSAIQDYWIGVKVRVPDTFAKWDTTAPVQLRYRTKTSTTTENHLTVRLIDTAGTEVSLTNGNTLANTSWTEASITGPESSGTFTAGSYFNVYVKMAASTAGEAAASYLVFNWSTTSP